MSDDATWQSVHRLLGLEAYYLDSQQWDKWLALFHPDLEYWVPAWDDSGVPTQDPLSELSLIYYKSRQGLEIRVARVRSGTSAASIPIPRTCHTFTLLTVKVLPNGVIHANSNWNAAIVQGERHQLNHGWAEYEIVAGDDGPLIRRKRVVLINDAIDTVADFYSL
jgi:3-phenylpropionate/cinnamic acid dioxygenase small subunit